MLLEAPQVWRTKWNNVLETKLVYTAWLWGLLKNKTWRSCALTCTSHPTVWSIINTHMVTTTIKSPFALKMYVNGNLMVVVITWALTIKVTWHLLGITCVGFVHLRLLSDLEEDFLQGRHGDAVGLDAEGLGRRLLTVSTGTLLKTLEHAYTSEDKQSVIGLNSQRWIISSPWFIFSPWTKIIMN